MPVTFQATGAHGQKVMYILLLLSNQGAFTSPVFGPGFNEPRLWNRLPVDIWEDKDKERFKKTLITLLHD